jgi:hypothetical protein
MILLPPISIKVRKYNKGVQGLTNMRVLKPRCANDDTQGIYITWIPLMPLRRELHTEQCSIIYNI